MYRRAPVQRQGEKAPGLLELGINEVLRHTVIRNIEETGLAAGLVYLPGY